MGPAWPVARVRHQRLAKAAQIIRELLARDYVNFSGQHFQAEQAKLFDLPEGFSQAGGSGKPRYGQLAICYDTSRGGRPRARPPVVAMGGHRLARHVRTARTRGLSTRPPRM